MSVNVYKNVLQVIPVVIANGAMLSTTVDSSQLPTGTGAAQLLGIIFPNNFPAATITIVTQFINIPNLTIPGYFNKNFCNGTQTNRIAITTVGPDVNGMDVSIVPYFLTPNTQILIQSSVAMTQDTTIYLNFQPIIQGAA